MDNELSPIQRLLGRRSSLGGLDARLHLLGDEQVVRSVNPERLHRDMRHDPDHLAVERVQEPFEVDWVLGLCPRKSVDSVRTHAASFLDHQTTYLGPTTLSIRIGRPGTLICAVMRDLVQRPGFLRADAVDVVLDRQQVHRRRDHRRLRSAVSRQQAAE